MYLGDRDQSTGDVVSQCGLQMTDETSVKVMFVEGVRCSSSTNISEDRCLNLHQTKYLHEYNLEKY